MSIQAICRHCGNTGVAWDTRKPCGCAMGRAAAQVLGEKKASEMKAVDDDIREIAAAANCPHQDGVYWNPYNHCVQCHGCGLIFAPWDYTTPLPESVRPIDWHASTDAHKG